MVEEKTEKYRMIMELKLNTSLESLCEHLPKVNYISIDNSKLVVLKVLLICKIS